MGGLADLIEQARPPFRTAMEFVSDTLRKAILTGAIKGGEPLKQDRLAAAFGVSRMPVREALRQLEAEGLIEFIPHRGAIVAKAEPLKISEIYEIRRLLEAYALKRSIPNLTNQELAKASSILDDVASERDVTKKGALNRQFHLALYAGFRGKRMIGVIEAQYFAIDRYSRTLPSQGGGQDRSYKEHREILRLCSYHDAKGAAKALTDHLKGGERKLRALASECF